MSFRPSKWHPLISYFNRDLLKGKTFEFEGHRGDFDSEMFDQIDEADLEEIEEVKLNPWQHKFDEMKEQMVQLEPFIWKKLKTEGHPSKPVPTASLVRIHYNAYHDGLASSYDSTYMRGAALTFRLGNGSVLPGLEAAIRSMHVKEESYFIISWQLLYGSVGCAPRIPPKADALFVIRVLDARPITLPEATHEDLTDFCRRFCDATIIDTAAKKAFKTGNLELAISSYKRAIHELEFSRTTTDQEAQEFRKFMKKLLLNLAVCYNKNKQPRPALSMIEKLKGLEGSVRNPKALYQEGKALAVLGEFESARRCYETAKQLAPEDENIISALTGIDIQKDEDLRLKREFAKNALQISSSSTAIDKAEQKKILTNEALKMSALLAPFMEGKETELIFPNSLTKPEIDCLKVLESQLKIKLKVTTTSSGPEYKVFKE